MPKKNNKKAKKRKNKKANKNKNNNRNNYYVKKLNVVKEAQPGIHIAYYNNNCINYEVYDRKEWGLDEYEPVPDISIDPETCLLSVINDSNKYKVYFITSHNILRDDNMNIIQSGETLTENGTIEKCTTLVLHVEPKHVMDVCYIDVDGSVENADIHSDVSEVDDIRHHHHHDDDDDSKNNNDDMNNIEISESQLKYIFPLDNEGPYLCTQGNYGCFTHFYPQTKYAYDFACSIGTPILAIDDGIIIQVIDKHTVSGIHVSNLYSWNSILLQLSNGYYCEYVHIKQNSSLVKEGDHVKKGDVICLSGNIGFCPTPHLHIQLHTSMMKNAPTIPFLFVTNDSQTVFKPKAGFWYNHNGKIHI